MHIMTERGWKQLQFGMTVEVKPAPKDLTLLEDLKIPHESCAERYCKAIQEWLRSEITEQQMLHVMGTR